MIFTFIDKSRKVKFNSDQSNFKRSLELLGFTRLAEITKLLMVWKTIETPSFIIYRQE